MKKGIIILIVIVVIIILLGGWVVRKYNTMQQANIDVQNQFAQVQAAYQRRADLIPNLVNTVKGAANFEKSTLTAVTEARVTDPNAFAKLQQAQDGLGSALQRLMVVVEKYPDLKANQNFLNLQAQLEGTENRINQERRVYNDTAAKFNKLVVTFPNVFFARMFNIKSAELFKASESAQNAPTVNFN
jgi:LemA protein